jgi:glycosyltransferase involved in cell wall biosynthesis
MRILIASTRDLGGGAEISAWNLLKGYRDLGHNAWLAVGEKRSDNPYVLPVPNGASRNLWARLWLGLEYRLGLMLHASQIMDWLNFYFRAIGEPRRWLETEMGYEDFDYPGTHRLLELCDSPDILHCFNLHGGYFDLRALPWLSRQLPVILDLRDAWLLSGHCAHSLGCDRWKIGCGNCPDLNIPPKILRDATAHNWQRKREIYTKSRFYVSTPCQWLMRRVEQSILASAVVESRVIPTGVDLTVFHSGNKLAARAALNLPQDARIILSTANGIRRNMWKDYNTLRSAVALVGERLRGEKILCVALGDNSPPERLGEAEVQFVPFQSSSNTVALYYQAADLYVHVARADTFPRVVLEALACGTPVIATAVGGIPEQIRGLQYESSLNAHLNTYGADRATGVLVAKGDIDALPIVIEQMLKNDRLRYRMSENAGKDAKERFNLQRQTDQYLEWYQELLHKRARDQATMSIA